MKKRLIAYLLVSALAVAVFAGCGKKGEGDGADAAATGSTAVAEEAAAADTAAAEVAAVSDTAAQIAEVAGTSDAAEVADIAVTGDEAVAEVVDEEAAEEAKTEDGEYLVVEPGTVYTVRYGGNVYSSPEENAANLMYSANPGDMLNIVERLDNYWYKVTYYISGEGVEHTGYIQIQ